MSNTPKTSQATPLWVRCPSSPKAYYVNSVAASCDGLSVVAGTFFKTYSSTATVDAERRVETSAPAAPASGSDPQAGQFGTYCYDLSGNLKWSDVYDGWQGIFWVDTAPAAPVCAAGGWYSNKPYSGVVRAYASDTGTRLLDARTQSRVNQVCLSADGSLLLAASEALYLYQNSGTGFQALGKPLLAQDGDTVVTAFLSGNGKTAVCATLKRGIFVFSVGGEGLVQLANWPWPASSGCCHSVYLTPDGSRFAAGGSGGIYALFDVAQLVAKGTPLLQCTAPNKAVVYSVALSEDGGTFLATANVSQGQNKGLILCNQAGSATPVWSQPTLNCPNRVVLNSGVGLVAVADGYPDGCPGTFYLLKASTGEPLVSYTSGNMAWGVSLSANGRLLAGGSDDANAYAFTAAVPC